MRLFRAILQRLNNRHVLSLGSNVLATALSLLWYILIVRLLTIEEFGQWTVFLYAFGTADSVRTYVVQTGLIKYLSGAAKPDAQRLAGSGWAILLSISAIVVLLSIPGWLLLDQIDNPSWQLVAKWLGLGLLAILPYNYATWLLQVDQRFDQIIALRMVSVICFLGLVTALFFLDAATTERVIVAYIISQLLTSGAAIGLGWAQLGTIAHANWATTTRLLHFGKFSVWTGLGSTLLRNSDVFIIESMLGSAAVAIYVLPQKAIELMEIPLRSLLGTAIPTMSAHANRGEMPQVAGQMIKYAGLLTVFMLPLVLVGIALADVYVYLVGGLPYMNTNAAHITRIFLLFAFMFPIDRFLGISLDIIGRPALNMYKVIIMLLVNVVGDLLAIYLFNDVLAVAAVSIVTFLVGVTTGHLLLKQHLDYRFQDFFTVGYAECLAAWHHFLQLFKKSRPI